MTIKEKAMEENKMQYLFGMHPVLEAVKAGKKFDKVLLKQGLEGPQFRELMRYRSSSCRERGSIKQCVVRIRACWPISHR